jgi:hypothetical protein
MTYALTLTMLRSVLYQVPLSGYKPSNKSLGLLEVGALIKLCTAFEPASW